LDRITQGVPLTPELEKPLVDSLKIFEMQAHKAQLTIPALEAFQKLLEAAATGGACANGK